MPRQPIAMPCRAIMRDMELRFVEGDRETVEIWLNQKDGPISWAPYHKVNKEDDIPKLYKVMQERGYNLPVLEEFTKEFLNILQNYLEGVLPLIPPK